MTRRLLCLLTLTTTASFANGVADMSGTTFTQHLRSPAGSTSMLPAFIVLSIGAALLATSKKSRAAENNCCEECHLAPKTPRD